MAQVEKQERGLTTPSGIADDVAPSFCQVALATCYSLVGAVMLWTRFSRIRTSLWHDEIYTLQHFVDRGPRAIFGAYNPNDHILFSVLGWLTVHSTGLGDSAYRLWSIIPFIAGVVLVTFWMHKRLGASAALVYAALCTTSNMLLPLSTEARGYGLAFLAMSVMTAAGFEASHGHRERALTSIAVAGVVGCWTVPTFVLPFAGVSLALITRPAIRRPLAVRLVVAAVAIGVWYAVPAQDLLSSRSQQFGVPLPWYAPITGAANALAAAFFPWISVAAFLPALVASPLLIAGTVTLKRRYPELVAVTVVPTVLTFTALTITRFYVAERFVSFLLVPILVVAAVGLETLIAPPMRVTLRTKLRWGLSLTYVGSVVSISLILFAVLSMDVTRLPREATRNAARAVKTAFAATHRPVIVNTESPADIQYYLEHISQRTVPVRRLQQVLCSRSIARTGVIFVQQPYRVHVMDTSCLVRRGATVQVFRQWDRGLRISVWALPPRS